MAANGVHLEFANGDRFKLKLRHKYLREMSDLTKRNVGELLRDKFGGWPYMLHAALRDQLPKLTLDEASDLIDRWCAEGNTFEDIGDLLSNAAEAAGYIRRPTVDKDPNETGPTASGPTSTVP